MKIMHSGFEETQLIAIETQKEIELDILQHVNHFCNENHIEYCIAYGTLIGAIRHKGFIPWDDDIDIVMTRENYNKFLEIFPRSIENRYRLVSEMDNDDYPFSFVKIEDTRTVLFEKNMVGSFNGIYIDVFPLDYVPEDDKERLKYVKKILFWHNVMGVKVHKRLVRHTWVKTLLSDLLFTLLKFVSVRCIRNKIIKCIFSIKVSSKTMVGNLTTNAYIKKEKYDVKYFKEVCKVSFEGIQVNAPKKYDELLRIIYGDYMQLPPEDKRVYRHGTTCYWKTKKEKEYDLGTYVDCSLKR